MKTIAGLLVCLFVLFIVSLAGAELLSHLQ